MDKASEPRERRRLTLKRAREEAERAQIEAWAWTALFDTLRRIVEATVRGIVLWGR